MAELKTFERTPETNHRAIYWKVFGGARGDALWSEITRMKLLEYGAAFDPPGSAPVLAALNAANWMPASAASKPSMPIGIS